MAVHDKFAKLAKKLITKHGRDLTLYKLDRAPANSAKPWNGPGSAFIDTATPKGVVLRYKAKDIDGELIRKDDKYALVACLDLNKDLRKFDKVVDGEEIYNIVTVELLKPGTTEIMYRLQLRT